jgi:hypothetical protein
MGTKVSLNDLQQMERGRAPRPGLSEAVKARVLLPAHVIAGGDKRGHDRREHNGARRASFQTTSRPRDTKQMNGCRQGSA